MRDREDQVEAAAEAADFIWVAVAWVAVAAEFRTPWEVAWEVGHHISAEVGHRISAVAAHRISAVEAHRISAVEAECVSAAPLMAVADQL